MSSNTIEEFIHRSYVSKPKYIEVMAGVPEDYSQIKTLGDLLGINYKHVTVERAAAWQPHCKIEKPRLSLPWYYRI